MIYDQILKDYILINEKNKSLFSFFNKILGPPHLNKNKTINSKKKKKTLNVWYHSWELKHKWQPTCQHNMSLRVKMSDIPHSRVLWEQRPWGREFVGCQVGCLHHHNWCCVEMCCMIYPLSCAAHTHHGPAFKQLDLEGGFINSFIFW